MRAISPSLLSRRPPAAQSAMLCAEIPEEYKRAIVAYTEVAAEAAERPEKRESLSLFSSVLRYSESGGEAPRVEAREAELRGNLRPLFSLVVY